MESEPSLPERATDPARGWRVGTLLALIVGAWLRLTNREVHSFWFEETATVLVAESADWIGLLRTDRHPPLSFLAFRTWIALGGSADGWLRLLPALTSCVSLALFAIAARAWLGARRAIWAAWIYALAPYLAWIAQEVRMYAAIELCANAALCLLHASIAPGRRRALVLIGLCIVQALAVGMHYFGALLAPAALAAACAARPRPAARTLLALAGALGAGVLVWLPWLASVLPDQLDAPWPFFASSQWIDIAKFPARLLACNYSWLDGPWRMAGFGLAGLTTAGLVLGAWRARRAGTERCALAWFLAPPLGALALALVGPLCFLPRYMGVSTSALVLLVAAGLYALRPRALAIGTLLALCACELAIAVHQRSKNQREDLRSACREIAAAWQPGDVVACVACIPDVFERSGLEHHLRTRPEILAAIVPSDRVADLPGESRVHVVWREAPYCTAVWNRLRERSVRSDWSPARCGVRRGTFVLAGDGAAAPPR